MHNRVEKKRDIPKSKLEGWLGMKMELPEILQGLVLASSDERGLARTETCIRSMETVRNRKRCKSASYEMNRIAPYRALNSEKRITERERGRERESSVRRELRLVKNNQLSSQVRRKAWFLILEGEFSGPAILTPNVNFCDGFLLKQGFGLCSEENS